MRVLVLILGIGLISFHSMSQVKFWPKAGFNTSGVKFTNSNPANLGLYDATVGKAYPLSSSNTSTTLGTGFYFGLMVDIRLNKHFSIRPELLYNQNNVKLTYQNVANVDPSIFLRLTYEQENRRYLTIPLNLVGHFKFQENDLQISLGAYASLGMNSTFQGEFVYEKVKMNGIYRSIIFSETGSDGSTQLLAERIPVNTFTYDRYYNPLDIGMEIGLGYQVDRVLISGKFVNGVSNSSAHYEDENLEATRDNLVKRNIGFSLGLAYRIDKVKL